MLIVMIPKTGELMMQNKEGHFARAVVLGMQEG